MSTSVSRPSYRAVLQLPHALRTFGSALFARLSYGLVPLAVLLTTVDATGSYAVSGVVMAVFGGTMVVLTPFRATLVDRYGPRRALPPMALAYAVFLCAFALTAVRSGPSPLVLCGLIGLTGACAPPLGPTMRAVWSELAPDKRLLQRAYSLDGVAEELLFVTGPVVVGVLVGVAPPVTAVLVSAGVMVVGTWGFVRSPGVREFGAGAGAEGGVEVEVGGGDVGRDAGAGCAAGADSVAGADSGAGAGACSPGGRSAQRRVLLIPLAVTAATGLALSAADLLVTAFADQHGYTTGAAAWTLAALSVGSAAGGLLNGAVNWRTPARTRLPRFAAALGLLLIVAGASPGILTLAALLTLAGAFITPVITTAYLIAEETATPANRTRAGAWINTAVNAGSSAGAAGAGLLLARAPLGVCFAVAGLVALVTGAGGVWGERR
ncbi:MFS transporter [Streptomyces roseirectus]|uniref:MFS transporter n=1 Tax=Streptomyces roseirectus TaxID=2768066 RepID=A0A7H0IBG6_9ACTN|nr:MFS transporter [Streptomyces roseirectus]QNP70132.1 MFS transporter [Streptomyces roseirectus]